MCPFRMKYLLLNSVLIISLGCASSYCDLKPIPADQSCIQKFKPSFKANWYSTTVDVVGKHISGLLLFKVMPDSSTRIVFTNEVGVSFFDFEFGNAGQFKVHQVIQQLDKKPVINLLRKDFELIMMRALTNGHLKSYMRNDELFYALPGKKETDYFITDKDCASLLRIEKASKRKKKTEVFMHRVQGQAPDSVFLKHFTFNMQITLKKLQR